MDFKCRILNCRHNDYVKSENDTGVCHCQEDVELEPGDCCGLVCTQYIETEKVQYLCNTRFV